VRHEALWFGKFQGDKTKQTTLFRKKIPIDESSFHFYLLVNSQFFFIDFECDGQFFQKFQFVL
jgi:hypothetical protein